MHGDPLEGPNLRFTGGDQKLQFRESANQGGRKGGPFAHPDDYFKIVQLLRRIFFAAQGSVNI
jgi:hypothetical protein